MPESGSSINEPFGSLANPYPVTPRLDSISPTSTAAGGAPLTLTCTGRAFQQASVICLNGVQQKTTFVTASSMTAQVTPKATAGSWPVIVITPVSSTVISTSPQTMTFT